MVSIGFIAFLVYMLSFSIGQQLVLRRFRVRPTHRREAPGWFFFQMLSMSFLLLAGMTADGQELFLPAVVAGVPLVIAGFMLSMRSQAELGKNWVGGIGLHKQHKLVTTGPYRDVRHPLYAGMLLSLAGIGIMGWNVFFLLAALCFAGAYTIRSVGEHFMLRRKFGKQYDQYASKTGALIPRIGK